MKTPEKDSSLSLRCGGVFFASAAFPTLRNAPKKPARERLHSQAGFSTLLPKIVEASVLEAFPFIRDLDSFCCFTESSNMHSNLTQKAPETKRSRGFKATPQGLSQSPETREIEPVSDSGVSYGVTSEDLERARRILEAAGLGHVADLLREYASRIVK